jgi:serine/threonine protein kinase
MGLATGTKLGPYEIQSPLGAGGMGEVYRARDTRLERTVAIKILPHHLSAGSVRKQRFEREAMCRGRPPSAQDIANLVLAGLAGNA